MDLSIPGPNALRKKHPLDIKRNTKKITKKPLPLNTLECRLLGMPEKEMFKLKQGIGLTVGRSA